MTGRTDGPLGEALGNTSTQANAQPAPGPRKRNVLAFLVVFVVLTLLGIWWAASRFEVGIRDLATLIDFPPLTLLLLTVLFFGIYAADSWRSVAFGRAMGVEVPWKAALDASVASLLFSWISPASFLGPPAAIFMLVRRGVPIDAAAIISFGKSMIGSALLLLAACIILASGTGPDLPPGASSFFLAGSLFLAPGVALLLLTVFFPDKIGSRSLSMGVWAEKSLKDRKPVLGHFLLQLGTVFSQLATRLGKFGRGGLLPVAEIVASNLVDFTAFAGIAAVLAVSFGAPSPVQAMGVSIVFLAFIYVAPTPGGAGLAEAGAGIFFGGILLGKNPALVVLLFRGICFHMQIVFGFLYILFSGCLGQVLESLENPSGEPPSQDLPSSNEERGENHA